MGTLTVFDAENGVDGADLSAANMPGIALATNGNGAFKRFSSQAAKTGRLGYHFNTVSGQGNHIILDLTDSATQAFRGTFRLLAAQTASGRRILQFRSTAPADDDMLTVRFAVPSTLELRDSAGGFVVGPALSVGVDYDISVTLTAGASTNDGEYSLKVYNANTGTQVGSTVSSSAANLGAGSIASGVYLGSTDSIASDIGFHWDFLRFENDRGEFPAPIAASATMIINSSLSASAVRVPYVSKAVLALEE